MQIFFRSPHISSQSDKCIWVKGFTLIELLISAAIITVISAIVIVRFTSFDSTVVLKSIAYEVGVAVREAQIYAVSVVNTETGASTNFRYPYGLSFTPGGQGYVFFRYNNSSIAATPRYESAETSVIRFLSFNSAMEVFDVCVTNNGVDDCSISRLDISFRRPEYTAIFYAPTLGSPSTVSAGKIYLRSTRNQANVWIVEVKLLGQIMVYKQ
jgi:prepilin-type N-terminal cleavage/methylation domain-containing protein